MLPVMKYYTRLISKRSGYRLPFYSGHFSLDAELTSRPPPNLAGLGK